MPEKPKQKDYAPLPAQPQKVSIEFALPQFDSAFKLKLPFLAILLFVFSFSLYLLAESRALSMDWFTEFTNLQNLLLPRLYSPAFLLFLLCVSLCFALSSFFGFGQSSRMHSVFVLLATMVPALAMGLVYSGDHPNYAAAFIALSLGVSSAAYFSAKKDKPTKSEVWYAIGNAMTFFAAVAFVATLAVVWTNNDTFTDKVFLGMANAAPVTLREAAKAGASAVDNYQVDNATIESMITEKDAQLLYDAMRDTTVSQATGAVRTMLEASFPTFDKLGDSSKASLTNGLKRSLVNAFPAIKQKFAAGLRDFASAEAQPPTDAQIKRLRGQMEGLPQFQLMKSGLPLALALFVYSFISLLRFIVRPVAVLATLGLIML